MLPSGQSSEDLKWANVYAASSRVCGPWWALTAAESGGRTFNLEVKKERGT